jgi:hypothetical protein
MEKEEIPAGCVHQAPPPDGQPELWTPEKAAAERRLREARLLWEENPDALDEKPGAAGSR